ncbi:SDR family NAD(P)-dependent oxidoreductase [Dinoroseobacter sp. PD6]|uniref:SDR family NAD(P)-dependent oxidoreductase n=1 Tax=Dinoroseobacter sp. PD6 TaxID=3028384 RepID=UPI00237B956F|nr:SDR family NAD(P)-dependent oxidoreductase [Dinoroseobacter sp. PD6]MDD9715464.1 SDR family NAD(P)-dependent oxidoreductase [Dinoroseobacter sp. PD6]
MQVSDHAILVTGGASGLGEATVRHLRAKGAAVAVLDRDATRGHQLAAESGALFFETDVTDDVSAEAGVTAAATALGRITACVTCAGVATSAKTLGRDGPHGLDTFQRTIDINLVGTFNIARLAAAEMARNAPDADGARGVIVTTASIAAFDGQKGQAAYAASKAGVTGLSLPMARDLAREGIRVMSIAPGIFRTPMLIGLGEEIMETLAADVTFPKRLGDPVEYARLVAFILECGYLNGTTIRLDGALRMP